MSIEGTDKHLSHARTPYTGADEGQTTWQGIKAWGRRNPRLSWIVWAAVALGFVVLLVWAIYPKPQVNGRFDAGPQPVGVATAVSGPINVTLNALGTVTPLATATARRLPSSSKTRAELPPSLSFARGARNVASAGWTLSDQICTSREVTTRSFLPPASRRT